MTQKTIITQKSIAGQKESGTEGSGHSHYNTSPNVARDLEEVKRTRMYIEKHDGTNISGIIIPHHTQIGLEDDNFRSDLGIKGNVRIEGDLTVIGETTGIESGGTESGGKFVFRARDSCQTGARLFSWSNNSSAIGGSAFANMNSMLTIPFAGNITAMSLHIKSNSTNYGNVQKITIVFYKSQSHATRTATYTQDTQLGGGSGGGEMTIQIDNFDGSSSNLYYKSHGISIPVSAGDVFQVTHQRVGGTNFDFLFSMTLVESS